MNVVECDVPSASMLDRDFVQGAYFRDAWRAPLSRGETGIVDVFFAIFAHHPMWMKRLLIVRNRLASWAGLDAPAASEILHVEIRERYVVGDKIGVWPIFSLGPDEVVAGRNNRHLDFRLSVMKVPCSGGTSVVVSTLCTVHNLPGKVYLFFVAPFHRRTASGTCWPTRSRPGDCEVARCSSSGGPGVFRKPRAARRSRRPVRRAAPPSRCRRRWPTSRTSPRPRYP